MDHKLLYQPIGSVGTRSGGLDMLSPLRIRLYLGPDHLLLVEKGLIREHYRRLYYRDLQALVWKKTRSYWWQHLVLLGATIPLALLAVAARDSGADSILWGLAVLLLLLNLALLRHGPSCKVFLKTPAQMVELSPIKRVGELNRLLARLRPLVQAHQAPVAAAGVESSAPPSPTP